ncbi:lachesin-like [Planococcus citri]|uniref:lachesin-like n=1 Tax=Planococcus citri TaxID=170843 RepID=UPI0031F8A03E
MKFIKLKSGILTAFFFLSNAITEIVSKISESAAVDGVNVNVNADKEPEFSAPIKNITVPLGREAVLTCSVTDLGNYKVGWMKAEDQTILTLHNRVVTHNGRVSVTHDNFKVWQLHIRQIRKEDKGCYMCQINTSIMKKQLGCIDVHVPPDISDEKTVSDVTVREGENATLRCKAMGHPIPRIIWKREDGENIILKKSSRESESVETFNGEALHLLKLDRRQMGSYLCIASNDVPPAVSKRITLHVNFVPVIKVPNELVGAPLGTDVTLECIVEAFPYTINYWVKTTENRILQGKKHNVEESRNSYKVHLKLTVRQLMESDLGTYMCVATNSLGRADGTVRVYEIKIPTTTPTTTTTTTEATTTKTTTTTTRKPTTTKFIIPTTYPPRKNSYNEKYQKNSRVSDDIVKNAISLTDGSHSKNSMADFKLVNHSARITFRTSFIFASLLFVISAAR